MSIDFLEIEKGMKFMFGVFLIYFGYRIFVHGASPSSFPEGWLIFASMGMVFFIVGCGISLSIIIHEYKEQKHGFIR